MKQNMFRLFGFALTLSLIISFLPVQAQPAYAVSPNIVISQVYGGGGNTGAQYKSDFVELFNLGMTPVSLSGWSVQYASATGMGNFGGNPIAQLSGTLQPGQYYLLQLAGGTNGVALPTPDATGTVNMSGTGGKVALVNTTTGLACNGGSTPCNSTQLAQIVDLVGWDGANFYETAVGPTTSNTTAAIRKNNGCSETDNNNADFALGAPAPRNTASPANICGGDSAPYVASTVPANGAVEVPLNSNIIINFSEPVNVSGSWVTLSCTTSGTHTATVSVGPTTFTLDPGTDFVGGELCTLTVYAVNVTDQDLIDPPDNMTFDFTAGFTTVTPPIYIHDIQGASHISPKNGQTVTTLPAIVTTLRTNGSTRGFYLQDKETDYDADPATSEGIFVFTGGSSNPASLVAVGDLVQVSGKVSEYRGAAASLTLTELVAPYTITKLSSGNLLPAPITLGNDGLIPPSAIIEDDASGSVETTGVFGSGQRWH